MSLFERYRPQTWSEIVGQEKIVATIDRLRPRRLGGSAYWITGQSGTGKSSIARLIAAEIADTWSVEEIDAAGLTAGRIQDMERRSQMRSIGAGGTPSSSTRRTA
jgi:replication-associated recombination protein RarA